MPYDYIPLGDKLSFAYLPRDVQRRAPFLDARFAGGAPQLGPFAIRDLPLREIKNAAQPMHFIFHTAFCCSTLLARAFDIPGVSMGLKEPRVVFKLSRAASTPSAELDEAITVVLDLLSRPLAPGETQIVKPTHSANLLAPHVLRLRPSSKVLVLYSSLDAFLRSTARKGLVGRAFARDTFQDLEPSIPLRTDFTLKDRMLQTDLQIAAQAWLMQAAHLQSVVQRFGRARVRTLNSDLLLDDKEDVLPRIAHFFGLQGENEFWRGVARGPVFEQHGKDPLRPFDAKARRAQLDRMGEVHTDELKPVLKWAETLASQCAAPLDLGNTLLD